MGFAMVTLPSNESRCKIAVVIQPIWFIQVKGYRLDRNNSYRAVPIEETIQGLQVLVGSNGGRGFTKSRVNGEIAPFEISAIQMVIETVNSAP